MGEPVAAAPAAADPAEQLAVLQQTAMQALAQAQAIYAEIQENPEMGKPWLLGFCVLMFLMWMCLGSSKGSNETLVGKSYNSDAIQERSRKRLAPEKTTRAFTRWAKFRVDPDAQREKQERWLPMSLNGAVVITKTGEGKFLVTNKFLHNRAVGMQWRKSMNVDDRDPSLCCNWETVIEGEEVDGFVKSMVPVAPLVMVEGTEITVAEERRINGIVWLKSSQLTWTCVHHAGVQDYFPITEDNKIDESVALPTEDHRSKFSCDKGTRLTHAMVNVPQTCSLTGKRLEVGQIALRNKARDWWMCLEIANSDYGLKEEMRRPEGVLKAFKPPEQCVCSESGQVIRTACLACGGSGNSLLIFDCGTCGGTGKADDVAFKIVNEDGEPTEGDQSWISAQCAERSPEFDDGAEPRAPNAHGLAQRTGQMIRKADENAEIYVYVPTARQVPGGCDDPSLPEGYVHSPRSNGKKGFKCYQRFDVVEKKTKDGVDWLKLANDEGWIGNKEDPKSSTPGAQVVFPLKDAIGFKWLRE